VIRVSDSGPALSEGDQASIFEPFACGVGEAATGLELSSVYGTIKQSGGYVWVASGPESGTTFEMYLRFAAAREHGRESRRQRMLGGRTVLVAEDDAAVRAVVRQTLLRDGYFVLEASDGVDALEVIDQAGTSIDALVTDLMMPNMGGRELAQAVTKRLGEVPILFISGYTEEAALSESILEPHSALLAKPFSAHALSERIRTLLEEAR
jgi:two-component system, cell cycle sensor histidine kinase and response regulator CckA